MMIYSTYMKTPAPTLSPILRSNAQGDLLAVLFLNPDDEFSLSDLVRRVGALPATVHREIQRLVDSDILTDRMVGRSRLVRVNAQHSLHAPLRELLLLTYGPKVHLEAMVADLPGVEEAYIYGSWAARYGGESGPTPRDVDVLVVGSTARHALNSMAREAELALHREVNVTRVSPEEWQQAQTPFVATLKSRPLVAIEQRTSNA